jgi:hypothetical protein
MRRLALVTVAALVAGTVIPTGALATAGVRYSTGFRMQAVCMPAGCMENDYVHTVVHNYTTHTHVVACAVSWPRFQDSGNPATGAGATYHRAFTQAYSIRVMPERDRAVDSGILSSLPVQPTAHSCRVVS